MSIKNPVIKDPTASKTWIEPEEYAYPDGGFTRRARVILQRNPHNSIDLPYGKYRIVMASIADTFFSIPARLRYKGKTIRGYLSYLDICPRQLSFTPEAE